MSVKTMIVYWLMPCFLLADFMTLPVEVHAQSADDRLWEKVTEIAEENARWIPGTLMEHETVLGENGAVDEETRRHIIFFLDEKSTLHAGLVSTVMNDKDITATEQKRFRSEKAVREYLVDNEYGSLLSGNGQCSIVERSDSTVFVGQTECAVFHFCHTEDEIQWEGDIWIAEKSGIPIQIHFSTEESYREDNVTISEYRGTVFYKHDNPDEWYPERISQTMKITAKAFPFTTYKGQLKHEIELCDYFTSNTDLKKQIEY